MVEVDATYYALPTRRMGEVWLERTPPDFRFDIKAHALMTGQPSELKRLPKEIREELPMELLDKKRVYAKDLPAEIVDAIWATFRDGILPLYSAGKLGAVFLQYPRWVFPSNESRDAILEAKERLGDIDLAVEFRHGSWLNEKNAARTIDFLEKHRSRWSWSTSHRACAARCRRWWRSPRPTWPSSASTAAVLRRGRRVASRS